MSPGVAIADLCEVNPKHPAGIDPEELVAFVGMADLDDVTAAAEDTERRAFGDVAKGYTPFRNGDVLMAKITPCFENCKIGQAFTTTDIAAGSTEFHVMRPRERLHDRYLLHFLRQPWVLELGELRMIGSGGQRRVPERLLNELKIPLPPIEEQRRIAAVLDAADELRTKRRQALAKLDTLTQAIFIDMFGDPVTNPRSFPEDCVLSDIADVRSGITKGRKANSEDLVKVPYLAVVNVQDGEVVLDPLKTIEASEEEIARYALIEGDLVLTEGGDPDKLGRGAVWRGQVKPCIHQNHVFRVRIEDDRFEPEFVSKLVGSERGKRYFLRMAKQTTGIASINMTQLRRFPLFRPPVELQAQYLERIHGLGRTVLALEASRSSLDTLFASLQQRAFSGEL